MNLAKVWGTKEHKSVRTGWHGKSSIRVEESEVHSHMKVGENMSRYFNKMHSRLNLELLFPPHLKGLQWVNLGLPVCGYNSSDITNLLASCIKITSPKDTIP